MSKPSSCELNVCVSVFYCRPHETVVPLEDPIVTEVTSTLQEWASLWKQLYVVSSAEHPCASCRFVVRNKGNATDRVPQSPTSLERIQSLLNLGKHHYYHMYSEAVPESESAAVVFVFVKNYSWRLTKTNPAYGVGRPSAAIGA